MLEQLLVRNITLPASVKTTIESKINAEQDAQKMTFVLQKEKQEAERKRVEAQGIADYQKILSTGLSDKQLQYEMIKAIATSPNAKLIIMDSKKKSVGYCGWEIAGENSKCKVQSSKWKVLNFALILKVFRIC